MDFAGLRKEGINGLTPAGVPFGIPAGVIFLGENTPPNCGSNLRIVRRRFYD